MDKKELEQMREVVEGLNKKLAEIDERTKPKDSDDYDKYPPYPDEDEYGDPGTCPWCKTMWEWVRPGKQQPRCDCQDDKTVPTYEYRALVAVSNLATTLVKDAAELGLLKTFSKLAEAVDKLDEL